MIAGILENCLHAGLTNKVQSRCRAILLTVFFELFQRFYSRFETVSSNYGDGSSRAFGTRFQSFCDGLFGVPVTVYFELL